MLDQIIAELRCHFPDESGPAGFPWFSFSTCSERETLWINSTKFLDQIFFLTPNQQCQSTDIDQWPFLILSLSSIGLQVEETLFDLRWPTVVMVWIILWVVSVCDAGILCLND